jgi:putative endonuclease
MSRKFNYPKGKKGEVMARKYLKEKGYRVLESNYQTRYGEIDLVCSQGKMLVFVEVKLKIGDRFGSPEEMIDKKKILQIQKTAQAFLLEKPSLSRRFKSYRIDAVAIVLNQDTSLKRITHYPNIGFEI